MRITEPRDPRDRRRHRAPEVDHLAAAVRLDMSLQDMRARDMAAGQPARGDDEPPTGLIDLNAIRRLLGQPTTGDVDPAAAAWLAGGADPDAARLVEEVDYLDEIAQAQPQSLGAPFAAHERELEQDGGAATTLREHFEQQRAALEVTAEALAEVHPLPTGLEYTCEVLGNAFHTAPCGDLQHPPPVLEVPEPPLPTLGELYRSQGYDDLADAWSAPPVTLEVPPLADKAAAALLPEVFAAERERFDPVFSSEHPRLTWRSRHDPQSLQFGVRRGLAAAPVADRMWWPGTVEDQGSEGACVGFGIVDALNARAAGDVDLTAADAQALYERARQLDEVPGESYSGTSVLAGLKAAQERGLIGSYSWCFGTRDIAQAVLQRGPVVIGVPWLSGMYDTGPGGLVELAGDDTGAGHCLAVVGVLLRGPQGQPGPYFVWQNSWGADYGDGGLGYIHHRDLATLLHGVGEAAVPGV